MSLTAKKIIDKARRDLHDTEAAFRWDDAILVTYINDAQYDLVNKRPEYWFDVNFDMQALIPAVENDLNVDLLLPDEILESMAAFITSKALSEDDADNENLQRAQIFSSVYQKITG